MQVGVEVVAEFGDTGVRVALGTLSFPSNSTVESVLLVCVM